MYIVPGNLGFGCTVFANITTFAPSYAHLLPIESPIPRDAPVISTVFPFKSPQFLN